MKIKKIIILSLGFLLLCSCKSIDDSDYLPAMEELTDISYSEPVDVLKYTAAETALPETTTKTETETEPVTESEPKERKVTFTALGDNLIHSSIYKQASWRTEGNGYDFFPAYAGTADLFGKADITVLNQETLICGGQYEPSTYPRFNSPPELGECMREMGVDVFTIANNHTLDKGTEGLSACLDYYDANEMIRVGAYRDEKDRADIRTMEVNGVTVSFLSYTEYLNGLSLPDDTELNIGMYDMETMKREIAAAKEISDICCVSLHWGVENSTEVQRYQRQDAVELAEAGADIIIGNHPHVLREIETFDNSDGGQTICAYSLGNLISAQSVGTNLIGGVLNFTVTLAEGSEPKIEDTEFIPIVTHYDKGYANVRLYKLSDYSPELADMHGVKSNSRFDYDYIVWYLESKGLYSQTSAP